MKNKILKIRKLLITTVLLIAIIGIPCISIGRAHTSSHSSSRSISHSVKSSTPKTSTKSTSSSVKSSTPNSTKSNDRIRKC